MKFEEAFAELRKDPDNSLMQRTNIPTGQGYIMKEGRFLWIDIMGKTCNAKPGNSFMAEDWEVKTTYHSGVEAIEAYKQGKWISHKDWQGGFYSITSHMGGGCLRYTGELLKQLSENAWIIKDSI